MIGEVLWNGSSLESMLILLGFSQWDGRWSRYVIGGRYL